MGASLRSSFCEDVANDEEGCDEGSGDEEKGDEEEQHCGRKTCQSSRAEGQQGEDQRWTPQKPNHEKQARQGGLENEVGDVAQKVQGQQAGGMDEGSHGSEEGAGHHWVRGIEWQNAARPSFVCEGEGELHSLSLHVSAPAADLKIFLHTAFSVVLV